MERDGYNIKKKPDCFFTLKYGPINRRIFDQPMFLGDAIYKTDYNPLDKKPIKPCETLDTYIDCTGKQTFTLPLDQYKNLSRFR